MDIFNELLWPQFKELNHVRKLPLNEQVNQYNQYLYDLSIARQSWIIYQNKGPGVELAPTPPVEDGFLLQEDLFDCYKKQEIKL
jgi:hypothetical protein